MSQNCRYNILGRCVYYLTPEAAEDQYTEFTRRWSLAARRVFSTCHREACHPNPATQKICNCTETLLQDYTARESEQLLSCRECYMSTAKRLVDANSAVRTFETQSPRGELRNGYLFVSLLLLLASLSWVTYRNVNTDRLPQEYICLCGEPPDFSRPPLCKVCSGKCKAYTLNAFTSTNIIDKHTVVEMISEIEVNGGKEGQEGWNNGMCLWFLA